MAAGVARPTAAGCARVWPGNRARSESARSAGRGSPRGSGRGIPGPPSVPWHTARRPRSGAAAGARRSRPRSWRGGRVGSGGGRVEGGTLRVLGLRVVDSACGTPGQPQQLGAGPQRSSAAQALQPQHMTLTGTARPSAGPLGSSNLLAAHRGPGLQVVDHDRAGSSLGRHSSRVLGLSSGVVTVTTPAAHSKQDSHSHSSCWAGTGPPSLRCTAHQKIQVILIILPATLAGLILIDHRY
jgi:hypothetical protein